MDNMCGRATNLHSPPDLFYFSYSLYRFLKYLKVYIIINYLKYILMHLCSRVSDVTPSTTPSLEYYYQYIERSYVDLSGRGGAPFATNQVSLQIPRIIENYLMQSCKTSNG